MFQKWGLPGIQRFQSVRLGDIKSKNAEIWSFIELASYTRLDSIFWGEFRTEVLESFLTGSVPDLERNCQNWTVFWSTWRVIDWPSTVISFVIRSAPTVALYCWEKRSSTNLVRVNMMLKMGQAYWWRTEVFPTLLKLESTKGN